MVLSSVRPSLIGLAAVVAMSSSIVCGSRSELDVWALSEAPTAQGGRTATTGGGGAGATGAAGGHAAGAGGETPITPCVLQQVGPPAVPSLLGESTVTPSLAVVDPGRAAGEERARVAIEAVTTGGSGHPQNLVELLELDRAWPDGMRTAREAVNLSVQSHSYGLLARSSATEARLALVHSGDPDGTGELIFRAMPVASWTPEPWAGLGPADVITDIAAGPSVGGAPPGYQGSGYAIGYWQTSWDADDPSAYVVIVDEFGQVVLGPVELPASTGPESAGAWGFGPTVIAAADRYLVASLDLACQAPGCPGAGVALGWIVPDASGGHLELLGDVVAQGDIWNGWRIGRPSLSVVGDEVWVVWTEGTEQGPSFAVLMRAPLSGSTLYAPVRLEPPLLTVRTVALTAGLGVGPSLSWVHDGDAALSDEALGRSFVVTQPLAADGGLAGDPIEAPLYGSALRFISAAVTGYPHGLLVAYSTAARSYVHRLDCGDSLPTELSACQPCPGAPPAEGASCEALDGLFCRYPSITDKAYNPSRCEDGRWASYGAGAPAPADGCPIALPSGSCSTALDCAYADQGGLDVVRCACELAAGWQCVTMPLCE